MGENKYSSGPRQVGKTTTIEYWAAGLKRTPHNVSADAVFSASHDWVIEQWQQARAEKKILIIDEIQKCENWAEIVKILWDKGQAFEVAVGAQLVRTKLDLHYWREGQHEVDFILKSGRRIWTIEVKSGRKKSSKELSVFCEKHPTATPVIITPENYFSFEKDPLAFLEQI